MTITCESLNDFLLELLELQQDGKRAISAPGNWTTHTPLLEVTTDVDAITDELLDTILVGTSVNHTARWHFFIGSPGNGKSAAVGRLCKSLMRDRNCDIRDDTSGVSITQLADTAIPYAINVYEQGNAFHTAQIVQDASVVRDPYSADVDPASELIDTLRSAWDRGISLVVCTNRGVLEKAHRDNHMNAAVNSTPWFKILAAIVMTNSTLNGEVDGLRPFEARKPVFKEVKVGYSHLDNRSLLFRGDTFARLLQKATIHPSWGVCDNCSARGMCPFKANRDWLADEHASQQVLNLLTRAEVLAGQVIVFREALAILSLLFAGCPTDYGEMHPCDWVRTKVASNDVFALASRRLYMSLFASSCPYGLESDDKLRSRQIEYLRYLLEIGSGFSPQARAALEHVVDGKAPSTNVGVTRLLGASGVLTALDPIREVLPSDYYDRWDSDYEAVPIEDSPWFTEIDLTCLVIWQEMEACLELLSEHSVSNAHWALRRWSSNFLLHFGALREGRSAWSDELDDFARILKVVAKPIDQRTVEDKRALRRLDERLEGLLDSIAADRQGGTIQLTESVTLHGRWVREKLKPKILPSGGSGSVSLAIGFEGGERTMFGASMFLWLARSAEEKLDPRCFPQDLLAGAIDARVRAAAKGKYAFQDNGNSLAA